MVGAAVQWHPVRLPLPLPAGPWPGKIEPSAGQYMIFHCAKYMCVVFISKEK